MGRKIKPIGLRRKPISITLPLDVISWLDRIVLSREGGTRSRLIEGLLRNAMLKGQTTLDVDVDGLRWKWLCHQCSREFHVNKKTEVIKCKCQTWLDADKDLIGSFDPNEEE
jgi:hypothetical protein